MSSETINTIADVDTRNRNGSELPASLASTSAAPTSLSPSPSIATDFLFFLLPLFLLISARLEGVATVAALLVEKALIAILSRDCFDFSFDFAPFNDLEKILLAILLDISFDLASNPFLDFFSFSSSALFSGCN